MKTKLLDKNNLQLIAAAAMLIDHAAFLAPSYFLFYLCHFIGRITIVIMCYFVAEGFYKTRSVEKYVIRMGIFAAVSQIPFYLYKAGTVTSLYSFLAGNYLNRNVIFTLFVGLCLLAVLRSPVKAYLKAVATLCALYVTRCSDWGAFAVLLIAAFGLLHGSFKKQMYAFIILFFARFFINHISLTINIFMLGEMDILSVYSVFVQLGGLLAIPLLSLYNGKKGRGTKFGLYLFYPIHLILLFMIKFMMF